MRLTRKNSSSTGASLLIKACLIGLLTMCGGAAALAQGPDKQPAGGTPVPMSPINNAKAFDYDGDGVTDIAFYRPSEGNWYILQSSDNKDVVQQLGTSGDRPVPADYNGDGLTDLAVFHHDDGSWRILNSNGDLTTQQLGMKGDVPMPADYDGDGKADAAVFRPVDGTWHILQSSDPTRGAQAVIRQWGIEGDVPVAGDYDGDGQANIAVFRPSAGMWYILNDDGTYTGLQWGRGGDKPVPADYDGDGRTDAAVFRVSTGAIRASEDGMWYVLGSTGKNLNTQWGNASDRAVPGDYDGDGKTDFTVFRPASGNWFASESSNNYATTKDVRFGQYGDVPVSSNYIVQ